MIKIFYIFIISVLFGNQSPKTYQKTYFDNGNIKSEGWIQNNLKTDYWFYYYENGRKKEEGHYKNDKKTKWWVFYDVNEEVVKKSKFENDKMDGLTIIYYKGNIIRAEKFLKGEKVKQWDSLSEFKKDNSISYNY